MAQTKRKLTTRSTIKKRSDAQYSMVQLTQQRAFRPSRTSCKQLQPSAAKRDFQTPAACSCPHHLVGNMRVRSALLLLAHVTAAAVAADISDIAGDYRLVGSSAGCPARITHGAPERAESFLRLSHSSVTVNGDTPCGGAAFTALLGPGEYAALPGEPAEGLEAALVDAGSVFGTEYLADRVCGEFTFRKGALIAIVRNGTQAAVAPLDFEDLGADAKYMLVKETGVTNPLQCVYRAENNETSTGEEASGACFPGSANIALHNGATVRADSLRHGHLLRLAARAKQAQSSHVIAFSHRHRETTTLFTRLYTTDDSRVPLTLSASHYVYSNGRLAAAGGLNVGDVLDAADGTKHRIARVESNVTANGLYAPHTAAGELVCEGWRVSSYTTAVHPTLAHAALAPLRLSWRLLGGWSDSSPIAPLGWLHRSSPLLNYLSRFVPKGAMLV